MKQIEYASIGGYVFSLEGNACRAASEYLDQLETFYSGKESGAEVMEGIEERMAELLLEKSSNGGVVTLNMIEEVISVLGRPEAIEEDPAATGSASFGGAGVSSDAGAAETSGRPSKNSSRNGAEKPRRRLYRDPTNGKLAGVCSGLATFFGLDPTLFRLSFVVLSLLGCINFRGLWIMEPWIHVSVPMLYLVLWICMPAVRTVRQRDELRGEGGTVDDISARVRSTSQEDRGSIDSESWKRIKRLFSVIFGFAFLLLGVAGISFLCSFIWGGEIIGSSFFYNRLVENIAIKSPEVLSFISATPVMLSAILVAVIPLFIMLYGGVMLIFGLKSPKWHPGLVLFVIWLVTLVALLVSCLMTFAVID